MSKRVKEAWQNSFSLRDVWEHYKGGSGLSNFLLMLGDMLDVIVTKIGVTIGAIFGLEEAAAESKAANALAKLKSLVAKTFEIIGWLYTNVLRPVLGTVIQFIATVIRDLGKSLREGDIKGALQLIRDIIKTFTSAQIFKLFGILSKVLGSGGLLRIFRNGAKALKGLWKLWGSEAINNIASAIFKLGVAIVLVASGLAALTFLPQKNLEKLNGMMISFVVVLAVILGMVVALTALADNATWGLLTMGFAFASITAMVIVFMIAAKRLHTYLESLFGGEDGKAGLGKIMGGLLTIAAPLLSVITVLLVIFKAISSLGKGGSVLTFSLGFVGMFIAINNIVNSMELMITMLRKYSLGEVITAGVILLAMFSLLALATKFMGSFKIGEEARFGGGIAAGVAMAITIASLALVIRMVLIPTLDTLIDNMDRWPDYVAALVLIAGAMIAMAGTIRLMNIKIANGGFFAEMGNFISTMGNLLFFIIMVNEIKNSFIPVLKELSETEINENTVIGIFLLGGLLIAVGFAIKLVATGIGTIVKSLALINFKALGSLVLMIGAVVLGIIAINSLLEANNINIEIESILIVIGAIIGVLVIFGVFALLMSKVFAGNGKGNRMSDLGKMLQSLALIIGTVVIGLIAILATFKLLYNNDLSTGITIMSTFLGTLSASVGGLLIAFGSTVKMMSSNVISINANEMRQVKGLFKVLMGIIIAVMAGILIALAEFKLLYDGNEGASLWPVLELVGGTLLTVCLIFKSFGKTIQELTKYNLANGATNTSMKHLKEVFTTLMFGIIGIMVAIIAGSAILGTIYEDDISRSILPVLEIVIGSAGVFFIICSTLGKFIREIQNTLLTLTIGDFNLNRVTGIILSMMLGTAAIIAAVVLGIVAINESTKGVNIARTITPALEIIISTAGTFFVIASTIGYLLKTLTRSGIVFNEQYTAIIKFLATIAIIIAGLSVVFGLILGALSNTSGENNIANAVAMILGVVGVFGILILVITAATSVAPEFSTAATLIAGGIAKIAGSLLLFGIAVDVLKSAFGLGQTIVEKVMAGVEDEAEIASPSKAFAKDGKFIDMGLAQGIKKNINLATSASKALATATNKSFQKELGIASPSKVFYENGKFVIRGFINGANSEYQKNKDIGSAIGEGFAETAAESISDEFEKLWTESGMLDDMKAALKDAGADLGSEAGKSLFGALMGEGEEVSATSLLENNDLMKNPTKVATEWSRYKNEVTKAENALIEFENYATENGVRSWDEATNTLYGTWWQNVGFAKHEELTKNVEEARKNLQRFEASTYVSEETFNDPNYQKKLKKYYSDIDAAEEELQKFYAENPIEYDDDGEISSEWKNKEDKLLKKVQKTQNNLNSYISKSFSSSGSTGGLFASFGEMFSGFGTQFGELFGISLDESITERFGLDGVSYDSIKTSFTSLFSTSGEEGAKSFKSSLYSIFGLNENGVDTGSQWTGIGKQIGGGIATGLGDTLLDGLESIILKNPIGKTSAWLMYKTGLMDASIYSYWDPSVLTNEENQVKFNGTIKEWTLKDQAGMFGKSVNKPIYIELTDEDAIALANSVWSGDVGSYFSKDSLKKVQEYLTNKTGGAPADSSHPYQISYNDLLDIFGMLETSGGDKTFYKSTADYYERKKKAQQTVSSVVTDSQLEKWMNNTFNLVDYGNVVRTLKDNKLNLTASQLAQFFLQGFIEGWLKNIDGVLTVVGKETDKVVEVAKKHAGVASPSWIAEEIGKYFLEGFEVGIDEEIPNTLDTMANATDLITEETVAGLNGMTSMLDHEITPTVTPVLDSSQLTSGIDTINSAVDSMAPRVDAAIGSFGYDAPNYTGNFDSLVNRINSTNELVGTLITMLESGAGVNISVTPEADPTNIYNLVIDMNRTEFKRTGRNNLAY